MENTWIYCVFYCYSNTSGVGSIHDLIDIFVASHDTCTNTLLHEMILHSIDSFLLKKSRDLLLYFVEMSA